MVNGFSGSMSFTGDGVGYLWFHFLSGGEYPGGRVSRGRYLGSKIPGGGGVGYPGGRVSWGAGYPGWVSEGRGITGAVGTHPTGMLSCQKMFLI